LNLSEKQMQRGQAGNAGRQMRSQWREGKEACELNLSEKQMQRGQADEKSMERFRYLQ
jgi:hypothetical protein